jgi:predicted N-acetyltransferase YhbS
MELRPLQRAEIELIWTIDRAELIERVYELRDGALLLRDAPFDVPGWSPGTAEQHAPALSACFDRGGDFTAAFDGKQVAGIAVLDRRPVTTRPDLLQLLLLHVGRDYRHQGLGSRLFRCARERARLWGAAGLYVSATPTENTIRFYLGVGCVVVPQPDPQLFAAEPEDIHLECAIGDAA